MTPALFRPIEHGADIVVHSLTKFMGGHGVSIGGSVTDSGKFSWEAFERLSRPDPGLHGLNFTEKFGEQAYIARLRSVLLRDTGACMSPFNAFTLLLGIETLSLRMERHVHNAGRVAEYLAAHPRVSWVRYPGLPSHPDHARAAKYLPKGPGAVLGFGIQGGVAAGRHSIERLQLFSHLANVGDAKSLAIHPASTTHSQLSEEELIAAGVTPDFIRLSIGLEDIDDILWDLEQALG